MESSEMVQKLLDMRIAVDILEDTLIEELNVVESLLNLGDVEGAKKQIEAMKKSVMEESKGETGN